MNFKPFFLLLAVSSLLFATSCGYHVGSMMHPQIKTIAIADVKNETKEPNLSAVVRGNLAEQFQTDGSLKLTTLGKADCIVYCRILKVENVAIRYDSYDDDQTFRPAEFAIGITAEFQVLIPGRGDPLIPMRQVHGQANYQYNADPAVGRLNGAKQASYNLARKIVQYTTEAW